MYIILIDRADRLGTNITIYLSRILYAHKNNIIIKFYRPKEQYRFNNSVFVKLLFDYIDIHNTKMYNQNIKDDILCDTLSDDYFLGVSNVIQNIQKDYVSYFKEFIYEDIKLNFSNIKNVYSNIPFDINKTILVHLRLDDTFNWSDYDGSICSNYYKEKIKNNEVCHHSFNPLNNDLFINYQGPLSTQKVENIINKAKSQFNDHEVILLTSPMSDTSQYPYRTIKNNDESYDLYLLTLCKVVILSRSNFALASLYFNDKDKIYIPLWGHTAILGFDTIYDNNDKGIYEYFY